MARTAKRLLREQPRAESPPTSRRCFLRAAALAATSLVVGACSRSSPKKPSEASAPSEPAPQPDPLPRPPTEEPIVRVRLQTVAPPDKPIEIGPAQQWMRIRLPGEDLTLGLLRGPIHVTRENGVWSAVDYQGFGPGLLAGESILITPMDDSGPAMELSGTPYPGSLQLHARPDRHADAFDVVSHVPLESYLPGVLARELYNHWHLETHTAQAIAARTFAVTESVFWRSRRYFDMTNTEASQVYAGMTAHATSLEAVRATRGVVLAYHNQLVPGYYSSSCGGLAARAVDAISDSPINDVPPLYGHAGEDACAALTQHRWRVTQHMETLTKRLQAYGKAYNLAPLAELAELRGIELSETNEHGRPTVFAIDAGDQLLDIKAERLRWAANFTEAPLGANERLLSSHVEPVAHEARITFHGRGRGHGAGMCQYGAESMASGGAGAMEILKYYYPGVEIVGSYA